MTVCFTAPTAYKAMLAAGKTVLDAAEGGVGGRAPAEGDWEAFRDATGVEIIDGIGATEMLHIFISAAGDDIRPGSTGRAVPGYVATVLDDDGQELPPGQPGRLAVKGPTGCRYLDDPRQAAYVANGWNLTGDTFSRDDDGYFWYQARSDDMIISSGYNIAGARGRGGTAQAPGGRRVRRRRRARRGARPPGQGVRGHRREDVSAAELQDFVKAADRSLQVPPRDRVRHRAAQDRHRQAPALPAPGPVVGRAWVVVDGRAGSSVEPVETRPPMPDQSPRHLILSLFGLYARTDRHRNALSVRTLIALMEDLDVDAAATRSSVSRLKKRGVLEPTRTGQPAGTAGYRLSESALAVLREGDARIWTRPRASVDDGWLVVVFSVPEAERSRRHELRSLLTRLGFGTAAPGVWVAPGTAYDETLGVLDRAGLTSYTELFRGAYLGSGPAGVRVSEWWDLPAIAALYDEFLAEHGGLTRLRDPEPDRAFAAYLPMLTAWRRLPYLDPGLPLDLLPGDWPGITAGELFATLDERLREPARAHAEARMAP